MTPGARQQSVRLAGFVALAGAGYLGPHVVTRGPIRRRFMPALSGRGPSNQIALTFDDGPDPRSTPLFMERLDELGWHATFFVLGDMVRAAPALTRELIAAGHEVALHGDHHRSHLWRGPRDIDDDLRRSRDVLEATTGEPVRWFRPPHGAYSAGTMRAAHRVGVRTVLWTAWGRDWTARATGPSVMKHLCRGLEPGGTVLLHDSDCTCAPGAWRSALDALTLLADDLNGRGLAVSTVGRHVHAGLGGSR